MYDVTVIGAGLAGTEAAWQLAIRGLDVELVEMRPSRMTPAHSTGWFGELVCSNSFKSVDPDTAPGMLKTELEMLGSVVLAVARAHAIPAGSALAVDRERFARTLTHVVGSHPRVHPTVREADAVPRDRPVIVAAGPLASDALSDDLGAVVGAARLHFYDAAAPIVDAASVDRDVCFSQSRYGKGQGSDYLNCPFDKESYDRFVDALINADRVLRKRFEPDELFAGCQPIEEIARRSRDAVRHGPLKPVGLVDPRTGRRPWAVLQLRPENRAATMYNLVGCQTNLTFPEQARVFRLVPGLEAAEFLRFGVMHRNTYVDSPRVLDAHLAVRRAPSIRLAGQIIGTEGYLEAAATGLWAALALAHELACGSRPEPLPATTALGSLIAYATDPETAPYQPMHVNLGLFPPLQQPVKDKRARKHAYSVRARTDAESWCVRHRALVEPARHALRAAAVAGTDAAACR